jgi:hypothetical protein
MTSCQPTHHGQANSDVTYLCSSPFRYRIIARSKHCGYTTTTVGD